MPQIDEPVSPAPKTAPPNRKTKSTVAPKATTGLFVFTVDADNGRIVTIEKVEGEVRHTLSPEERAKLARDHGGLHLRRQIERAFEAGIDFVLGDPRDSNQVETEQEDQLSRLLLQTIIENSDVREMVAGETLDRTLVSTLFSEGAKPMISSDQ